LLTLMADPQAGAAQLAAFGRVMAALGQGGEPPSVRAARSVLEALERLPARPRHPVPPP
jgi:lipid-A-disaccharide synthase